MVSPLLLLGMALSLPAPTAAAAPVPTPADHETPPTARPMGEGRLPGEIFREGLPPWARWQATVPNPADAESMNQLRCLGEAMLFTKARGLAEFPRWLTPRPVSFEAFRVVEGKREPLDLSRIEAAYERDGARVTGMRLFPRGSVILIFVTDRHGGTRYRFADTATGKELLTAELEAAGGPNGGEPMPMAYSSNGRFVAMQGTHVADRARLTVVDLETRKVRTLHDEAGIHRPDWISEDGSYFQAHDGNHSGIYSVTKGRLFPPPGSPYLLRPEPVRIGREPGTIWVRVRTKLTGKNEYALLSLADGKVLRSRPVPAITDFARDTRGIPLRDGEFWAFPKEAGPGQDDRWGLYDAATGTEIASGSGPRGEESSDCLSGEGFFFKVQDQRTNDAPVVASHTLVDPDRWLRHLLGTPARPRPIAELAVAIRSADVAIAIRALVEASHFRIGTGVLADAKYDGEPLGASDTTLLAGLRDRLASADFDAREAASREGETRLKLLAPTAWATYGSALAKLARDADPEVAYRAAALLDVLNARRRGTADATEIARRFTLLDEGLRREK